MRGRIRLDQLVIERGLAETRARAAALLLAGHVRVGSGDAARLDRKPGDLVASDTPLSLRRQAPFVSRGGEKLAAALDAFGVDPRDRVCLDVGASTGGFTDCLLQRGARRVYALDVGRGQLAVALRADPRVIALERTHARRLRPSDPDHLALPEAPSLIVADVSFIRLSGLLPAIVAPLAPGGEVVALVKPQFEAEPGEVQRGVVRDPAVHRAAVARVAAAAQELGLAVAGEVTSPLLGPAGNREWFLRLRAPDLETTAGAGTAAGAGRDGP
ncbi:MAG: TlyA family RNA methyltransferase [Candidatus Limnocylindrales bacterium]